MTYRPFSLIPMLSENLLSDRFTQIDKLFSRITGEKPLSGFPSYDLKKKSHGKFELTLSVPGYKKDELEISVLNKKLSINGKVEHKKDLNEGQKWLHRGIEKGNFSVSFDLDRKVQIETASLADGLLTLHFYYETPKEEKAKKITIVTDSSV
ncbi:heat-shock protein (plasmid) [Candidatus Riesia sp. GBBU]|nr:heat-shock protein [Candidatus Riesia sp. GBBU]